MPFQQDARPRLIGLFLLGLVLFLPPLVKLHSGGRVLGIPSLYFYLFSVWFLLIAALAFTIERRLRRRTRQGD